MICSILGTDQNLTVSAAKSGYRTAAREIVPSVSRAREPASRIQPGNTCWSEGRRLLFDISSELTVPVHVISRWRSE